MKYDEQYEKLAKRLKDGGADYFHINTRSNESLTDEEIDQLATFLEVYKKSKGL